MPEGNKSRVSGDGLESLSQKGGVAESDAVWVCGLEGSHRNR